MNEPRRHRRVDPFAPPDLARPMLDARRASDRLDAAIMRRRDERGELTDYEQAVRVHADAIAYHLDRLGELSWGIHAADEDRERAASAPEGGHSEDV